MDECGYSGRLRKRKRTLGDGAEESIRSLLELLEHCGKLVIFSGSGLSANSGMSMFTTKNGLYERARHKFKIQDGMKLFSYPFYKQRRKDLQAFFAQIYSEAQSSRAAPGHVAIAELHRLGRLQRHYTLNIDGLSAAVGMDTWHHENNPEGSTVEMHGNISYVVCPSCHAVEPLTGKVMETMKACEPVICHACKEDEMRFKVMLYDDEQGDCITPEDVFERLEDDLAVAGAVIWVGISFEQSASTEYFRKVRHMLANHGRLHEVPQVLLNPSDEPYFNVISTMSNREDVKVLDVRATSDDALPRMVKHLHHLGGTSPDKAALRAAAEAATAAQAAKIRRQIEHEQAQSEEHSTPKAAVRRRRNSGSAAASPADHGAGAPACQGFPSGSVSFAELSALDSAAAAALSLPAAVQKHFLQQQLQLTGVDGVKVEADEVPDGHGLGSTVGSLFEQTAALKQQQPAPTAGVSTCVAAAGAAPMAAGSSQPTSAKAVNPNQQAAGLQGGLQQLVNQLQALHALQALQAALAPTAQQQQQPAVITGGPASGLTHRSSANTLLEAAVPQQPAALNALLAAALAAQPAAGAATQQAANTALAQLTAHGAASGSSLAAVLAASPAAASLLLSNPAVLAAVAATSCNAQSVAAAAVAGTGTAAVAPGAGLNGTAAAVGGIHCVAAGSKALAPEVAASCQQQPGAGCSAAPCSPVVDAHGQAGCGAESCAVKEQDGVAGLSVHAEAGGLEALHAIGHGEVGGPAAVGSE